MKTTIRLMVLGAGLMTALFGAAPAAQAEMVTAATGSAWHGNFDACFRRDFGRVSKDISVGNCNGDKLWTIGVRPVTGVRTFKATGCSANNTSCAAIVTDKSGMLVRWTGQTQLTTPNGLSCTPAAVTLGPNLSVGATEAVVFECNVSLGGTPNIGADFVGTVEY